MATYNVPVGFFSLLILFLSFQTPLAHRCTPPCTCSCPAGYNPHGPIGGTSKGSTPSTGTGTPSTGTGGPPGTGSGTPSTGSNTPSTGTPSTGTGTPSMSPSSSGSPTTGSGSPSSVTPSTGSGSPSSGTPRPSTGSGSPSSGTPSTGSGSPSSGTPSKGSSSPTSGTPSTSSGSPSSGTPSTGSPSSGTPSTGSGSPSSGTPSTGSGSPSSGTPSTGSDTPSTGAPPRSGTPSTGTPPTSGTPSTGTPPSSGTPSTTTPSSSTTPSTGTPPSSNTPSTGSNKPNTGSPPSSGTPSTGTPPNFSTPSSSSDNPSTGSPPSSGTPNTDTPPNTGSKTPSTGNDTPPSSNTPNTSTSPTSGSPSTDAPPSSEAASPGTSPSTGSDTSITGTGTPSTGSGTPSTGSDNPSTGMGRTSLSTTSYAGSFQKVFAFGGSYTDTGNCALLNGFKAFVGALLHKPRARQCDGRLVIDFLTETLGLPSLPPYKSASLNFSCGVNFAISGSTSLSSNYFSNSPLVHPLMWDKPEGFQTQIGWFANFLIDLKAQAAGKFIDELTNSLFWVGEMGLNDYVRTFGSSLNSKWLTELTVGHSCNLLKTLLDKGAKYVVVQGLPPAGCLPVDLSLCPFSDRDKMGCSASANLVIQAHNELLKQKVEEYRTQYSGSMIIYADYWGAYTTILSNPSKYGFQEPYKACCGCGTGLFNFKLHSLCGSPRSTVCQDPSTHISWDGIHLTEAMHKHVADLLLHGGFCQPSFADLVKHKLGK